MPYLRTLLTQYSNKPTIENIELNCRYGGYEDEEKSLVLFYFSGTYDLEEGLDGELAESTISTEDGLGIFVPGIAPILVDGWYNESDDLEFICLKFAAA